MMLPTACGAQDTTQQTRDRLEPLTVSAGQRDQRVGPGYTDGAGPQDAAILAEQLGLPLEHVLESLAFQQEFAYYAMEVGSRFPSSIAAVWVEPVPAIGGPIVFVGDVPESIHLLTLHK